ncbi:MAG: hypothetical protein ACXAEE_09895 [Candidatus Thorarchaeota archaeon]|jgi:uncharacterized membrane protein
MMDSEDNDESVFSEYKELGPKTTSKEQYIVALIHIIAAIGISIMQVPEGFSAWLRYGVLIPILLIAQGVFYAYLRNPEWYQDQMIPYISRIVMVTEIEADQFVRHHRRLGWYAIILGCVAILACQMIWTWGFTVVMPFFSGDDFITRLVGEIVGYAVLFGPFFLYIVLIFVIYGLLEYFMQSRNDEIQHIYEITNKWVEEDERRKKPPESENNSDNASEGSRL